jgi:Gpi18-like mannosyltransferase
MLHLLFAVAIALRLILIPNPGFEADISFWKSWGLATVDYGIVEGMKVTNNNYPTPFAYILGAMVGIYKLFADPHVFGEFWRNTNLLFLTISKLVPVLADFGIAGIFLYIGKHAKEFGFPIIPRPRPARRGGHNSLFVILAIVYLLNPIAIIDGAWWGQVDSLGVFLFLLAFLALLKTKSFLAGFLFMLAMMTKLQNMIYSPLFFLFIWQTSGFSGLVQAVSGATLGFFGLNIEFVANRTMNRVIASLTENYDYFPWMSLMAYNLWWIVTGAKGMVTSDKLTVLGIVNAKTIGLLLFSSLYLFAMIRQFFEKNRLQTFLEGLITVNAAFFLFQTQSHDRYAFPLIVFLLLWAPFYVNHELRSMNYGKNRRLVTFIIHYSLFTVFYFYNLHRALVINYPHNGLPILSSLIQPFFTIITATVLLGLFFVFLFTILRTSRSPALSALLPLGLLVGSLLWLNKPLWTKQPVSLTNFTPFISEQAYGGRQTNKAVQSSFGGPYKWTRLSVQYLFYEQGIGTHANSKHVFDINRKFNTFTTDFGIDTEAGTRATAVFEIFGDDKLLFRSDKMGRFDLPKHAEIPISGVKYLTLTTTDAGDGNFDDHTDWLNPTLYP